MLASKARREYFGPPPTRFGGLQGSLRFHRRAWQNGHVHFIKNDSDESFDDWIAPVDNWASAAIMDPLDGRVGLAAVREVNDQGKQQLRLQLASWAELAGAEGQRFAGTARYALTFDAPGRAERYLQRLGTVADSVRVVLNGQPVAR